METLPPISSPSPYIEFDLSTQALLIRSYIRTTPVLEFGSIDPTASVFPS